MDEDKFDKFEKIVSKLFKVLLLLVSPAIAYIMFDITVGRTFTTDYSNITFGIIIALNWLSIVWCIAIIFPKDK